MKKKYEDEVIEAAKYIRSVAAGEPIESEVEISLMRDGKEVTFGTYDAYSKGNLYDLKTGSIERNYVPQMAVYAAAICARDNIDKITVHLIYSALGKVDLFTLSRAEAEAITYRVIDSVNNPTRMAKPCDYCKWCHHLEYCEAVNTTVMTVAEKQELILKEEVAAIKDSKTMGVFKDVAQVCSAFIDMVKEKGEEFDEIDGWIKSSRRGKKKIKDITAALIQSGLPSEVFVSACSVSYSKLKKKFAEHKGVSEQEADKELSDLISSTIQEGRPVTYWRKEKK